jgi:hypothetical protein
MLILYNEHLRKIPFRRKNGYCIPGGRRFFERYGLDWEDFVKNGIDSELLLSASDNNVRAVQVVEYALSTVDQDV